MIVIRGVVKSIEKRIIGKLREKLKLMKVNIKQEEERMVMDLKRPIGGMKIPQLKRFREEREFITEELTKYRSLVG